MDNIMYFIRKNCFKIIIVALVIFVIIPICFYIKSPLGIIPKGESGNVLTYYGAVLGGLLTFIGVFCTLYYNNKQNIKSEITHNIPLIHIQVISEENLETIPKNELMTFRHFTIKSNSEEHGFIVYLFIKNIGNGVIKELIIKSIKVGNESKVRKEVPYNKSNYLIPKDKGVVFKIHLPPYGFGESITHGANNIIEVTIECSDYQGNLYNSSYAIKNIATSLQTRNHISRGDVILVEFPNITMPKNKT